MARQKDTKVKSKMSRSETVSIRLDPRLNYLCELAARSQRRSKSSFIEATIAETIQGMTLNNPNNNDYSRFGELENYLWQVEEHDRLISLGIKAPHLLTFEEQELWTLIARTGWFWKGRYTGLSKSEWNWDLDEDSIIRERVEKYWETLNDICDGSADKSNLPKCDRAPSASEESNAPTFGGPDLDDEIPF
ncbi:MAG: hypothetical protein ACPGVN_04240 [Alphaproteobacteria bacterium]